MYCAEKCVSWWVERVVSAWCSRDPLYPPRIHLQRLQRHILYSWTLQRSRTSPSYHERNKSHKHLSVICGLHMSLIWVILYFLMTVKARGLFACRFTPQSAALIISVDRPLARSLAGIVASNYFTVTCGGCATSSESSLISAAGQLYLTDASDVCSCTGMFQTFICLSRCSHGYATLKGFWLPAKTFRAQQIFMTPFMVRKQYVYLRTFSSNGALPNKPNKPVGLAAGRDVLIYSCTDVNNEHSLRRSP